MDKEMAVMVNQLAGITDLINKFSENMNWDIKSINNLINGYHDYYQDNKDSATCWDAFEGIEHQQLVEITVMSDELNALIEAYALDNELNIRAVRSLVQENHKKEVAS